jgi:predicted O-methyltransferase YrrM
MNDLYDEYKKEFEGHLAHTQRWGAFCTIAALLLEKKKPLLIVETGTARIPGNWGGDGQSTLQWAWMIRKVGGYLISIDKDIKACKIAESSLGPTYPKDPIEVVCADSIRYLASIGREHNIDLLYLDSFDYAPPYFDSELHHVGELAAIWSRLPSGCLIAVDDCLGDRGKHVLVDAFFKRAEISPLVRSYITIWKKP